MISQFNQRSVPRWVIFLVDLCICALSIILAYMLRFDFGRSPDRDFKALPFVLVVVLAVRSLSFILGRTHAGIIRFSGTKDSIRIFLTILSGSAFFTLANLFHFHFIDAKNLIPYSIIIIDFVVSTFVLIAMRMVIKVIYVETMKPAREKENILIFGAGESGMFTKRALDRDAGTKYKTLAFIDDNSKKENKKIEGVNIVHSSKMQNILQQEDVEHVIISVQNITAARKQEIIDICLNNNTHVMTVPPVGTWINGELSFKQIKEVRIEDLLGREVIQLDEKNIRSELSGKTVMITGAAGSIGSELVRQINRFSPKKMILVDQAETPLFHLEIEMAGQQVSGEHVFIIGDIRNKEKMASLFNTYQPDVVYHAAAYKHVPMMENNPCEAVRTNVEGTRILADLALECQVPKFVMVSTDKAVNPTNIMGASKRMAEIYTQSLNKLNRTKFITTRFGNVLGSNGSVIELFKRQISKGGPITVTHPEVTRFFMTIPEACQLVLEAGAMGNGGEIFIFDMGKSVKIVDLAKKMIKLSGLSLGKDIQLTFTKLRPGEKLYEELLNQQESTLPTHHPLIMIAQTREYDIAEARKHLSDLSILYNEQDGAQVALKLKNIIPEFISQNSVFEKLDN